MLSHAAAAVASHRAAAFITASNCRTKRARPRPAASDSIFVSIVVKAPIAQILTMLFGFVLLALDYPAPFLKNTAIHRSFPIRIVLLLLLTFFANLFYQVRTPAGFHSRVHVLTPRDTTQGTNGAIYSFIAALCYTRAQLNGEAMPEAKDNKGRGGKA